MDEVISRHGVPTKLITDHGRNFEADLMKKVFEFLGVKKLRTSPYHPQTDGQVERLNRTLKGIVTTYVNQDHDDWDIHLPLALFADRNSVHAFSGVSPFLAVNREFKMPTTNNGYGVRLKACFRIALTEADKIYISPEHTFHRSDLGYSVKITFLCCRTESRT